MKPLRIVLLTALLLVACDGTPSSDEVQQDQQEKILKEGTAQTGMPSITTFRERRMMKEILEKRDQASFTTYTYLDPTFTGRLMFLCNSIGYPIPYATQYTNPQKIGWYNGHSWTLPQADPNGLFSPSAADGTWIVCQNPAKPSETGAVYSEPKLITSPFPLTLKETR